MNPLRRLATVGAALALAGGACTGTGSGPAAPTTVAGAGTGDHTTTTASGPGGSTTTSAPAAGGPGTGEPTPGSTTGPPGPQPDTATSHSPERATYGYTGTVHRWGDQLELEGPNPTYDETSPTFTRAAVVPTDTGWDVYWGFDGPPDPGTPGDSFVTRWTADGALVGWDWRRGTTTNLDPDPTDEPTEEGCRYDPPLRLPTRVGDRLQTTFTCEGTTYDLTVEAVTTETLTIEGRAIPTIVRQGSALLRDELGEGQIRWREWYAPGLGVPARWEDTNQDRVERGALDPDEELHLGRERSFTMTFRPLPGE